MCDPTVASGLYPVTPTIVIFTLIVSDIYYKWINTNVLSWTLRNMATYLKEILNL
jgi:hypothetical protein